MSFGQVGACIGTAALLMMCGCRTQSAGSTAARIQDLFGRTWVLAELTTPDVQTMPSSLVTMEVQADSSIAGSAGCNTYRGRIQHLSAGDIAFSPLAATRMACSDDRMNLEEHYLAAMSAAATYVLFADTLVLLDSTHVSILRFVSQPGIGGLEQTPSVPLRGYVRMQESELSFRRLSDSREFTVRDLTGELATLYGSLATQPGESVYVALDADIDYGPTDTPTSGGKITVRDIYQVQPPEASPQVDLLRELLFLARGNEPFWAVRIFSDSVAFLEPDARELILPLESPVLTDTVWRFEARSAASPGQTITVDIRRERCTDGMSGAFSNLSATVHINERTLTGCAIRGDVAF